MNYKYIKVLILLFYCTLSSTCYSQNITIKGIIKDSDSDEILAGANIFLNTPENRTISNEAGKFKITNVLLEADSKLSVSFLGYHPQKVQLSELKNFNEIVIKLDKSYLDLDQVVVTGTRTERFVKDSPVTTEVINQKQIQNSGASDLKQVLSEINGVVVRENQFGTGVNTVEIQGFSSQHIQILVDGIKIIGRVNGELDISQMPLSQIERIEIVKGSASALYGSEAMGGVINIITKKGSDKLSFGTNLITGGYGRLDASILANIPLGNWVPAINASYRTYGGYDLNKKTVAEDGTNYNKYNIGVNLPGKIFENTTINFKTFFLTEQHVAKSSSIFEDHILNNHFAGKIQLTDNGLHKDLNTKIGLEYSRYEHKYDKKVLSSGFYKKGDVTVEQLLRGDILADYLLGSHLINGGYSIEKEKITSDRVIGSKQNSILHNVFLQDEIFLYDWMTFLGGIRLDAHSVYGSRLTPKAAIMLKPIENSRVRLSYAEGFRAPSFKELFIEYINLTVGYHIKGNPELEPELSKSFQTDLEYWNNDNYHVRVHSYFNKISNLIEYKYLGVIEGYGVYTPKNLLSVNTWGGDFEIEYFPYDFLNFKIGYSYFDSENSKTRNPLTFKSKHKYNFSINVNFFKEVDFNFRGQFFGNQYYWADYDEKTNTGTKKNIDSYIILHTNLNYKMFEYLKINLGIRNLNNYVNKTWGPMPGCEWYAGLSLNY